MNQEVRAHKDQVLLETMTYEDWARRAAYELTLLFEGAADPIVNVREAETQLSRHLKSLPEEDDLPACLSPERTIGPLDPTGDVTGLVRALYKAATGLYVFVDAQGYEAYVLLVGEKIRPPHRYLLSISGENVRELVADNPKDLGNLYRRITTSMAQIG